MVAKVKCFTKNGIDVWAKKIFDRYWVINGALVYLDPDVNDRSDVVLSKIVDKMNSNFLFVPGPDFNGIVCVYRDRENNSVVCKYFSRLTVEEKVIAKSVLVIDEYKLYSGYRPVEPVSMRLIS